MNWKLGKQMQDSAGGIGWGWGGIDLINCARQPIEGCRFSGFRPLYPHVFIRMFYFRRKRMKFMSQS